MIDDLVLPLAEETTINVAGTLAAQQTYVETSGKVQIDNVNCVAGSDFKLTIRPTIFNESNYGQGRDPFSESNQAEAFNVSTTEWPCVVPPFVLNNCRNVIIEGFAVANPSNESDVVLVHVSGHGNVDVRFCSASGGMIGFSAIDFSTLSLANFLSKENKVGVALMAKSFLILVGENFILDCTRAGVMLTVGSTGVQMAWEDVPSKCVTEISTTQPAGKYAGVTVSDGSLYKILEKLLVEGDIPRCYLKILNRNAFKSKEYTGVSLEGHSAIIGTKNIFFSENDVNQGQPTIDEENQFVIEDGEGSLVRK